MLPPRFWSSLTRAGGRTAARASRGRDEHVAGDVAAEVVPANPQRAHEVAKALAQRGFRVLHVGRSVSVQAPRDRWEQTFGVAFTRHAKAVQSEPVREASYLRARAETVRIPTDLHELIADVAFVEPPELH